MGRLARKMVGGPVVVMWEHWTSSSSSTLDCNSLEVKIVVEEYQKRQLRIFMELRQKATRYPVSVQTFKI